MKKYKLKENWKDAIILSSFTLLVIVSLVLYTLRINSLG